MIPDGVGECEIKVAIATQFQMHAMSVLLAKANQTWGEVSSRS